jgi:hypothetical protein
MNHLCGALLIVIAGLAPAAVAMPAGTGSAAPTSSGAVQAWLASQPVPRLPASALAPSRPGAWPVAAAGGPHYLAVVDDFEESALNPELWPLVADLDGPVNGEYFWGISAIRAASGSQSFWAVGAGADGSTLQPNDNYPCGARSAAWLKLDLTGWSDPRQLDLLFDFWLNLRTVDEGGVVPDGLFVSYLEPSADDPLRMERVTLKAITAENPAAFWREPETIDLLAAKEIYPPYREWNFSGQVVIFEFLFKSKDPPCMSLPEGVFVDNIRLEADTPPGTVPTSTATSEVTPTDTPEPGETPTDTPEPGVTPTDTPEPGETPTDTPEPGVTPTDTPEPGETPTGAPTTPVPGGYRIFAPIAAKDAAIGGSGTGGGWSRRPGPDVRIWAPW